MRTLVFLPAWNEVESIATVLAEVSQTLPSADLLVVDDGSHDATARVAREAGALVASFPFHVGIGAAVQTGYLYANRHGYDICAHLDADGQHPARELARLITAVESGEADLALGSRFLSSVETEAGESLYRPSRSRSVGMSLFRFLLSKRTGLSLTDTTSGLRAANRLVISEFAEHYANDYPELESLQRLARRGLRIVEYPIVCRPRTAGSSKLTPLRSAHFVFTSTLALLVGLFPERRGR